MRKDLIVYLLLLVIGLGAAYYVSLPKEVSSDEVSYIKLNPKEITSIAYRGENKQVVLTRKAKTDIFWGLYSEDVEQPKVKASDKASDPHAGLLDKDKKDEAIAPAGEVEDVMEEKAVEQKAVEQKVVEFKADSSMGDLLDWFNPLFVKREVGSTSDLDLKEFELDQPKQSVEIKKGKEVVFELKVGKRAYGSRNYFVLDPKKKRILLVSGSKLENLFRANNRMFQKKLLEIDFDDVVQASIRSGNAVKEIDHSSVNGAGKKIWTNKGSEEEKPAYKNLMTKIVKLRVKTYGTAEERQSLAATMPFAEVVFEKSNAEKIAMKFVKQAGSEPSYWVWSDQIGGYAQILKSLGENLERDMSAQILD